MDDIDTLFFSSRDIYELYNDNDLLKISVAIESYISLLKKDMGKLVESIVNMDKTISRTKDHIKSLENGNIKGAPSSDLADIKNHLDSLIFQNQKLHTELADKLRSYKSCHRYT